MSIGIQPTIATTRPPSPLRLSVRRTPAEVLYLSDSTCGWISNTAQRIITERGSSFPLDQRQDWQADLALYLWRSANKYDPTRDKRHYNNPQSAWRAWAYKLMQNEFCDLLTRALNESRYLPRAEPSADITTLPDLLSRVGIDGIRTALTSAAMQEVEERLARDFRVIEYLAEAGGQEGAFADLERELRITRYQVGVSVGRIRRAMEQVGLTPNTEVV